MRQQALDTNMHSGIGMRLDLTVNKYGLHSFHNQELNIVYTGFVFEL